MLQKLVNEAIFTLRITTTGPLLVKSGKEGIDGPKMTPVLTSRKGKEEPFIPGSSLKGVFRSHSERVVGSLKSHVVCYPFEGNPLPADYRDSCGDTFNQIARRSTRKLEERTDLVYEASCPTCRLFGSTSFIGRIAISDAYLASQDMRERRNIVGIDRLTSGSKTNALFDMQVVSAEVAFETEIHLRNFELWQLGMLFAVIQDMDEGLVRVGSGRSRSLGKVSAVIVERGAPGRPGGLVISTIRQSGEEANQLWGLGRWLKLNDRSYGTEPDDYLQLDEDEHLKRVERIDRGIRSQRSFTGEALKALRARTIANFAERMQAWPEEPQQRLTDWAAAHGDAVEEAVKERVDP